MKKKKMNPFALLSQRLNKKRQHIDHVKWLMNHSVDPYKLVGTYCQICYGKLDYQLAWDEKHKTWREIRYVGEGSRPICKRCWLAVRMAARITDYCIMVPWLIILKTVFRSWRLINVISNKIRRRRATPASKGNLGS